MIPKLKNKPPGNRMLKKMRLETKSIWLMVFTVVLVSLGLYVFVNAITAKNEGAETFRWVLLGTYSLVLINLGLFCLSLAIRFRLLMDINKKMKKTEKKLKHRMRFGKNKNATD
jgi:uncharacterized membrane protein YhaH (DUF805 family)